MSVNTEKLENLAKAPFAHIAHGYACLLYQSVCSGLPRETVQFPSHCWHEPVAEGQPSISAVGKSLHLLK